jgi:cation transport regulator
MYYRDIDDLPDLVRYHLPKNAQKIFIEAFNTAWEKYTVSKRHDSDTRKEIATIVAWSAVKKQYDKDPISDGLRKKGLLV